MDETPTTRKFQELWKRRADSSTDSPELSEPNDSTLSHETEANPSGAPRSLWHVMRSTESPETSPSVELSDSSKPKGLWSVMNAPTADAETTSPTESTLDAEQPAVTSAVDPNAESTSLPQPIAIRMSRSAAAALLCGVATLLLALLGLGPTWLLRVPALLLGLLTVWLGLLADSDIRASRGRRRGRAIAWCGIIFGGAGMFLAPTVVARWGEEWRIFSGQETVAVRMRNIGQALERHHDQHGHYPAATVVAGEPGGTPLHGWMTSLLPYLGFAALHAQIDQQQPFNAAANRVPMSTVIPEFQVPGSLPTHLPAGLAATHFAGVGGSDNRESTGFVHLGLFDERGTVRRESVSDNRSQTLIVGEISSDLPAWGQPGNIRSIGKGLNRQAHGFGNAAGTGAMFLHADGSVRFYAKDTDRRVLEQLETRDGHERPGID